MFTGRDIPPLGKHRKAGELNSLINSGSVRCWRGVGGVQKKSQVKPDQLWRKQGWQHTEWGRGHFLSLIRLYNNTQIMRGQQSRENKRTIHSTTKKCYIRQVLMGMLVSEGSHELIQCRSVLWCGLYIVRNFRNEVWWEPSSAGMVGMFPFGGKAFLDFHITGVTLMEYDWLT